MWTVEIIYVPWSKALEYCYKLAVKILDSDIDPDIVIAISRGGLVPARIVSDILAVDELLTVRAKLWGVGGRLFNEPQVTLLDPGILADKKVLVIDEVVDTGATMKKIVEDAKKAGAREVATGVLHFKSTSSFEPDFYVEKVEKWVWIFYPWSFSETLYGLAVKRGGDVVKQAFNILKEVGATELFVDPLSVAKSIEKYVSANMREIYPPLEQQQLSQKSLLEDQFHQPNE